MAALGWVDLLEGQVEGLVDLAGYQVADLVDLGDYQAIDLVGLVDREGLDLWADLQALLVLLLFLVPMEGQPLRGVVLVSFSERFPSL